MASLVIVSMLVVILTLISLGFAKLMDRALSSSVNSQLGSAAYYAARSAISDVMAFLSVPANSGVSVSVCNDPVLADIYTAGNLSDTTKYTCLLIDQTPQELIYQKIEAFKSQVVKLQPEGAPPYIQSVLLSWQSTDRKNDSLTCGPPTLLKQSEWATQRCEPILRVSIYPIDSDGDSDSLADIENRAKTFFLFPSSGGSDTFPYTQQNGSITAVDCDGNPPNPFSGSGYYHCNLRITGMQAGGIQYLFIRLTPLYRQADIKIKAATGGSPNNIVGFVGAQAVIDVTAKTNTTVRRLAARVDISNVSGNNINISPSDNSIPEFAIRSAGTLCKKLTVNNPAPNTTVDSAFCNLTL